MNHSSRKFLVFLIALCVTSFYFQSCNSDDDNTPPAGTMTADIDNVGWIAATSAAQMQNGMMNVTGTTSTGSITLTMDGTEARTYDLSGTNAPSVGAYVPQGGSSSFLSNAAGSASMGSITVSEINTDEQWISGTFSFLGTDLSSNEERIISNGEFTEIPLLIDTTANTDGSLTMKVDGDDWVPTSLSSFIAQQKLSISATNTANNTSFGLIFPEDIAPGQYELDWLTETLGNYNLGSSTQLVSKEGTLVITEHDQTAKHIEGTFLFLAEETSGPITRDITEGTFSIDY